jgi:hypothetical protein
LEFFGKAKTASPLSLPAFENKTASSCGSSTASPSNAKNSTQPTASLYRVEVTPIATDDKPDDNDPLRLADAVTVAFPLGGMTVSGLPREIARGRLEVETIAGKQFVTLRAIREMRERCRVPARAENNASDKVRLEIGQRAALAQNAARREAIRQQEREEKRLAGHRALD